MLAKAMKRAVYVMSLVFFMFIFAVAGVLYFGEQASGDLEHWGDLGSALLTIFGLVTLDGWVDLLKKVDSSGVTYSRLFLIIFILIGHFIFFNMFVGLVIMEVERMTKAREEESLQERKAAQKRKKQKINNEAADWESGECRLSQGSESRVLHKTEWETPVKK
ncbi:cation channel sperm-associated protein 3-like [Colossoma macropomum]|uniref:cation channel sperm-associated protein 3-like n=1 Tax=Colossoma macropomum TaxID=42526 RepID=UPI0018650D1D|nr:cation channel sperm-associated protein 3-like [Colossoma macropomum]XP_036417209.1 cation channel sperm-associated protein 3-like [Colossoma macropomum]